MSRRNSDERINAPQPTLQPRQRSDHSDATQLSEEAEHDQDHNFAKEKGDDSDAGPPAPVGFWHPSLKGVRNQAIRRWTMVTLMLMTFILSVLSLYWAAFYNIEKNLGVLVAYVVDMDGAAPYDMHSPLVGPTLVKLSEQLVSSGQPTIGWRTVPGSDFDNDPMQVRRAIWNEEAWLAVVIPPNSTAMLYNAIATGNSSYDPNGAIQLIYEDSRDDTNWYDYLYPIVSQYLMEATAMVGKEWASMVLQNASDPATLANMQKVPQAISPAVGVTEFNLRPFYPYTATPAVSIGLIYLIILSFFSFSFYIPIHMQYVIPKGHPPLKFWQLIVWRWLGTILAYFFMSWAYSAVSLAFGINFSGGQPTDPETPTQMILGNPDAYGKGTFLVYWMLNFVGMSALGLACENMAMFIGQPWMAFWLIFWVITNVSTSFYDLSLLPGFFHWGYAWPLHSIVEASRQIIFDLKPHIGRDFGILFGWCGINTALFPFACYWLRYKKEHNISEYWT